MEPRTPDIPHLSPVELDTLIASALSSEASPVDVRTLRLWMERKGINMTGVRFPGDTSVLPEMPSIDSTQSWEDILGRLEQPPSGQRVPTTSKQPQDRAGYPGRGDQPQGGRYQVPRIAGARRWYAAAGLVASAALFVIGQRWMSSSSPVRGVASNVSSYTTANGERSTITLPDGSSAILNVGSRLEVPANYGATNRTVRLVGEAFFTVANNMQAPFIVQAGPGTARVLGTQFVVRFYPTDTATVIAVRDGKVSVRNTVLSANQQAVVNLSGAVQQLPALASQFSFASGVLTFDDVLLTVAIPDLNRWYDADIRLGDSSLARQRITAEYTSGSLTDLVALLEMTFNVRVVREGRTITLYPQGI